MKKLLMTLAMTLAVSNAFAKEEVLYNEPYVPILEIPNLNSMPVSKNGSRYSFNVLINPNKISYMRAGVGEETYLYFIDATNETRILRISGSVENALYEFSKNECYERKPECTNKDIKHISLLKTPIFISIEGQGDYSGMIVSININNIEYIGYNPTSNMTEITLSPYTIIPTTLSMDELSAIIYGATH